MSNPGYIIESYAVQATNRTLLTNIDRHYPPLSWAVPDASGHPSNFHVTKDNVIAITFALNNAVSGHVTTSVADGLGEMLETIRNSRTPAELGDAIRSAWDPYLATAFKLPASR